ncbi:acyl-CoA dehydrogenase [Nitrospirillum iridis]|uniref:Alkylation response protein AidB-like acyl-CoA dehydrogenase n=1 Tax=Nitrospirillum iridis TaxID=765888 RepID=A0A7X0EG82_9PROT|nr:acyl-CoA dehydrogenase [Nitrospirillum iridis]MBB6253289.1 alkylation response protein AidB-like acyl-CoA dehydrogenase [Nitrospirillum iridis]
MDASERYHPAPDQRALVGALGDTLADLLPLARLHGTPEANGGEESAAAWSALQELGLFGIALAEDRGGSGLGAVEEALIARELGTRLAAPTIFATLGAAHARGLDGLQEKRITTGYRRDDHLVFIADRNASLVLLRDGDASRIVPVPGEGQLLDGQHWLAEIRQAAIPEAAVAIFDDAGVLRLRLNDAAALAGMAQLATDMAVDYAKLRTQFGRPIGSFQAVKHHCANMAIAARTAGDLIGFAAVALDDGRPDAAFQVESALLTAGSAAIGNAGLNIQIHGGMGFSDEADPHLVLKRARLQLALAGGLEAANHRLAALPPMPGAPGHM